MISHGDNLLTRRGFLAGTGAATAALLLAERFPAFARQAAELQRIQRSAMPLTLETPLAALDRPITPNDLFYVRNHFPEPTLEAKTWRRRSKCIEVSARLMPPGRRSSASTARTSTRWQPAFSPR